MEHYPQNVVRDIHEWWKNMKKKKGRFQVVCFFVKAQVGGLVQVWYHHISNT